MTYYGIMNLNPAQGKQMLVVLWAGNCSKTSTVTRGTNMMRQLWFIIINISTCFRHLYAHLQE